MLNICFMNICILSNKEGKLNVISDDTVVALKRHKPPIVPLGIDYFCSGIIIPKCLDN